MPPAYSIPKRVNSSATSGRIAVAAARSGSAPALVTIGVAAVDDGGAKARIDPDRVAEVRDRAIELAPVVPDTAAIVEGKGVFGIEPDRFRVMQQRLLVIALDAISGATIIVC